MDIKFYHLNESFHSGWVEISNYTQIKFAKKIQEIPHIIKKPQSFLFVVFFLFISVFTTILFYEVIRAKRRTFVHSELIMSLTTYQRHLYFPVW